MYEYAATIVNVVDGDTVHARVDLGIDIDATITLRLYGINAPELTTQQGKDAKAHLISLLTQPPTSGGPVTIRTVKDHKEKYGRYLATIILADGSNANQRMVDDGYAVVYYP